MGLFDKNKEPIFLKEKSNSEEQLEILKALEPLLNSKGQIIIKNDIKCLEYGIAGEKNIEFELKNSHTHMYILHDIYIEYEELSAQIDYLVFTNKQCFVIECKNLYGNIEINNSGDFIRTMEFGNKKKKEGIYSPITQNKRHLELMKKIRKDNKKNFITKLSVEKFFEDFNIPIVVLANPKTVVNSKYAKKDVKEKIIRADQLVKYIKDMNNKSKERSYSSKEMREWAESYLSLHKEIFKDYTEKYSKYKVSSNDNVEISDEDNLQSNENIELPVEEMLIYKELKEYRLNKSREEKNKPYFIYSDKQLKELIINMPRTKKDLLLVNGFGDVKVEKYGNDIIDIINKY